MSLLRRMPIVLFVDDEEFARKYFERAFSREMNIHTAGSADEARIALASHGDQVAVLITDQQMPDGNGVQLLSEVKEKYPHVVRLLTTAYTDIEDAIGAVNRGEIWRYITKPWKLDDLKTELDSAMEVYRARTYETALLQERRRGMLMVASHIAHEMRTPLRSIHSAAHGLENNLPRLLEGYDWAVRAGAEFEPLTQRHRQVLQDTTASVQRVVNRANTVIDLLLANAGAHRIDPALFEICCIETCLATALRDFPFTDKERARVLWEGGPAFKFHGSTSLMILVLHNLLRNALQAVAAVDEGQVHVWTDTADNTNGLHIRDTGIGIGPELLPRIFDDFTSFSDDDRSVGIGLGFCRKVLTGFGSHIECHSEKNRYTQFDVWLPVPGDSWAVPECTGAP